MTTATAPITTVRATERYWIVCDGTQTTYRKSEADARAKAAQLLDKGVNVLRIERQIMTTATTTICEF